MKSLIKKLVEIHAPSGYEAPIRQSIREEITSFADEIRVDALGNLIAVKNPTQKDGKKIMLAAHTDEIGIMATHIDNNGFIRFIPIGGVKRVYCLGGRVRFMNGVGGIIGFEYQEDETSLPTFEKMYVDVGATERANCPIQIGDIATFDFPFSEHGDRLMSKAMDDRIGVAVLIETLRQLKSTVNQVFFVFSVQEEVGLRGATTAAYGLDPDVGIAVDVTRTGDTPKSVRMEMELGKGPAIKVRDSGMLSDPRVVDWMVRTAKNIHIPYQLEVLESGTTDARAIQLTRSGVPVGCLSIPCRYVHSPTEMVDLRDVHQAVDLLLGLVQSEVILD
jgi:endoglucanase